MANFNINNFTERDGIILPFPAEFIPETFSGTISPINSFQVKMNHLDECIKFHGLSDMVLVKYVVIENISLDTGKIPDTDSLININDDVKEAKSLGMNIIVYIIALKFDKLEVGHMNSCIIKIDEKRSHLFESHMDESIWCQSVQKFVKKSLPSGWKFSINSGCLEKGAKIQTTDNLCSMWVMLYSMALIVGALCNRSITKTIKKVTEHKNDYINSLTMFLSTRVDYFKNALADEEKTIRDCRNKWSMFKAVIGENEQMDFVNYIVDKTHDIRSGDAAFVLQQICSSLNGIKLPSLLQDIKYRFEREVFKEIEAKVSELCL